MTDTIATAEQIAHFRGTATDGPAPRRRTRVPYASWGSCAVAGSYAMQDRYESRVEAVKRSVERQLAADGLTVCSWVSDGRSPDADHYYATCGTPCRGGGMTPRGRIWISVPRVDA